MIKYPNYYQITSFINLLGQQLKKFSQSFIFSSHYLQEDKKNKYGSKDIRSYVIEKFIFNSKYIINGGFINLINEQTKNYKLINKNYDENIENGEKLLELAQVKDNSISFKEIENTLLLFSEEEADEFDIISNKKNIKDYERYIKILQSQSYVNDIKINYNLINEDENNNKLKFIYSIYFGNIFFKSLNSV